MKLNLTRPLAFFDLETTGTNIAKDRIIQIFILKVHPNGQGREPQLSGKSGTSHSQRCQQTHGNYRPRRQRRSHIQRNCQ